MTQGGKDHTSHRLVYYGLSEQEAVALLATVAVALGATGLAYNVLDNGRITAIGVLVSVVLLVQFGNFLTELREHSEADGPRPSLRPLGARAPSADRDRRRLRADVRLVPRRVPHRRRRARERRRARRIPRRAARRARDALPLLRARRHLPARVAVRHDGRRARRRAGLRRVCRPVVGDHRAASRLVGLPAFGLRARCDLRDACSSAARASPSALWVERGDGGGAGRAVSRPDRRGGQVRAQLRPRGPGDARACGSSGSSTTTRRSAGAGSPASRVLGPTATSWSASFAQSEPTEVIVTIADGSREPAGDRERGVQQAKVPCSLMHRRLETVPPPTEVPAE